MGFYLALHQPSCASIYVGYIYILTSNNQLIQRQSIYTYVRFCHCWSVALPFRRPHVYIPAKFTFYAQCECVTKLFGNDPFVTPLVKVAELVRRSISPVAAV